MNQRTKTWLAFSLTASVLVAHSACTSKNETQSEDTDKKGHKVKPGLPTFSTPSSDGTCTPPSANSFCGWLHSTDVVALTEVVDIGLVDSPLSFVADGDPSGEWQTSYDPGICEGHILMGLQLHLRATDVVFGDELAVDDEFTLHVGEEVLRTWNSIPALDDSGEVVWVNTSEDSSGIIVGQELGVPAHADFEGTWSLLGDKLFVPTNVGYRFQEPSQNSCDSYPVPAGFLGSTDSGGLHDEVTACSLTGVEEGEELQWRQSALDFLNRVPAAKGAKCGVAVGADALEQDPDEVGSEQELPPESQMDAGQ